VINVYIANLIKNRIRLSNSIEAPILEMGVISKSIKLYKIKYSDEKIIVFFITNTKISFILKSTSLNEKKVNDRKSKNEAKDDDHATPVN